MQVLRRVALYIFPVYPAVAEYLVREYLIHDLDRVAPAPVSIVGPSIVAAAMVLLFPALVPKPLGYRLPLGAQTELEQRNLGIYSVADLSITFAAWIVLFILAGVWILTLYLAHKNPLVLWHVVPVTMLIGGGAYLTGILLTELKGI
jgi:hypothetical protein